MPRAIASATSHYLDTLKPLALDVVSVQSQVVYGRVGNNVAMPTLWAAGLKAAAVPTVVFSNTPHYASIHGGAVPLDWFQGFLDDLQARESLSQLRAVLIGYLGTPAQAEVLAVWLRALREARPQLQVVLDPVIGDEDSGVYVADGMLEALRTHLLPVAGGLTPNGFELGCLSRMPVETIEQVEAAARSLLRADPWLRWIAVTSAAPTQCGPGEIQIAVVQADAPTELVRHRRIGCAVKGTGDLFSATLTAELLRGASLHDAIEQAGERVAQALESTREARCAELLLPPRLQAATPTCSVAT